LNGEFITINAKNCSSCNNKKYDFSQSTTAKIGNQDIKNASYVMSDLSTWNLTGS